MIYEIKDYLVGNGLEPTHEDIVEVITIARENRCVVRLNWTHNGAMCTKLIMPGDNAENIYESLKELY